MRPGACNGSSGNAARLALVLAVAAGVQPAGYGCGVDRRCRSDEDCSGRAVCLESGVCGTECVSDEDCTLDERCEGARCVPACLACGYLHAQTTCTHGDCVMTGCEDGWNDIDGELSNGCEYACVPSGIEICNDADDDCDGAIDDGFNTSSDPMNCGSCGNVCPDRPNSSPLCGGGVCGYVCDSGWYEQDGIAETGCESDVCLPTGDEICDMMDNDCDGSVDEGIVKDTPESCGPLCVECDLPNAAARCVMGGCEVLECTGPFIDCGTAPGCETPCAFAGAEICNDVDDDCDCLVDEGVLCCPEGMVEVETYCIDKWEVSHPDATAGAQGSDTSMAVSQGDVLPWQTGSAASDLAVARAACTAAGKRLCTLSEWTFACQGPDLTTYSYGAEYDPDTCNGIDSHCEDPYTGCGMDDYLAGNIHFRVEPTGSYPDCTNEWGLFDVNGNLWEWVDVTEPTVVGGAYNCSNSLVLHRCTAPSAAGVRSAIGFRCCL